MIKSISNMVNKLVVQVRNLACLQDKIGLGPTIYVGIIYFKQNKKSNNWPTLTMLVVVQHLIIFLYHIVNLLVLNNKGNENEWEIRITTNPTMVYMLRKV